MPGYNNPHNDDVIISGRVVKLDLHEVVITDILEKIDKDKKLANKIKYISFDLYMFIFTILINAMITISLFLALK